VRKEKKFEGGVQRRKLVKQPGQGRGESSWGDLQKTTWATAQTKGGKTRDDLWNKTYKRKERGFSGGSKSKVDIDSELERGRHSFCGAATSLIKKRGEIKGD